MFSVVELTCSRRIPQAAVLALISVAVAGCSADMTTRFQQTSVSNPFAQEATGSVPVPSQPVQPVQRQELPSYGRPQAYQSPGYQSPGYQSSAYHSSGGPPVVAAPLSAPLASNANVSGGGRGIASYTPPAPVQQYAASAPEPAPRYTPPAQPRLDTTGSVPPRPVTASRPSVGTTIIVGTSDTLESLAQRYRVTPGAILAANGYRGPRALSPGQQLVIPHAMAAAASPVAPAPVAAAPVARPVMVASPSLHVVNPGDTLASIARRNHVSVAELARANNLDVSSPLRLGSRLTVPAAGAAAQPVAMTVQAPVAGPRLASAVPPQSARLAQAAPTSDEAAVAEPPAAKATEATNAPPTFRWPVRGKVITSYGAKTNGKSNDGINVAVPEGTPVKAAEDGVVAYAGNELKGYGNLVLVRHTNGYVTAYAHASELMVKRGDAIKRGQVIAKSGQSGEVASPQLHFEIRKGSNPVDPLQFLNGA
ncbi:MAG: peptidoglycan DD-metalloendopeptidase family protein [Bradyrhizobium sp.]|uniref:peptidoglycan DD-metalloendopeptidase family protein n=1 Tax=Bradyrhizobium sp. TaxID=376 RepID=UPI001E0F0F4D|nr:peptidoglycan DD-metalloendopeptidase family protein [Bradyrhizobium sp.]MBV9560979.1 peptidoglycan DD-metalloendopeptidase family protein [Bradyrhizobium sp.]